MAAHWQLKLAISAFAIGAALVAAFQERLGVTITGTVAVLLALAVVPWLSPLLQSAELPGGWKLEFRRVEAEQLRQRADIDALSFLVSGFVTGDELTHLRKLATPAPFPFVRGPETTHFFDELRRLRSLGLIANCGGKSLRQLDTYGGDVKNYFVITDRGREYLRLLEQVERAGAAPQQRQRAADEMS